MGEQVNAFKTENRTWGIFEEQIQNTKTGTTALKSNNAHVIAMEL